jgi:hypothetical protein
MIDLYSKMIQRGEKPIYSAEIGGLGDLIVQ